MDTPRPSPRTNRTRRVLNPTAAHPERQGRVPVHWPGLSRGPRCDRPGACPPQVGRHLARPPTHHVQQPAVACAARGSQDAGGNDRLPSPGLHRLGLRRGVLRAGAPTRPHSVLCLVRLLVRKQQNTHGASSGKSKGRSADRVAVQHSRSAAPFKAGDPVATAPHGRAGVMTTFPPFGRRFSFSCRCTTSR